MHYEDIAPISRKITKKEVNRLKENNINDMSTWTIIWYLINKHKFGLLVAFTVTYVTISLFHTLLFGLIESLK